MLSTSDRQAATKGEWSRPVSAQVIAPARRGDWMVHLTLTTIQGDMRDLSVFADASFDCIFHPISNLYVPDIRLVWQECFRVLRPGAKQQTSGEAMVFGHSLSEQIGGQPDAGFVLKGFYDDEQPNPRLAIDRFLPTFLATYAMKL